MTTRLAWTSAGGRRDPARRDPAVSRARPLRQQAHAGWRSHTFQDGVRSLTLVGPLDASLAGRLWTRISELVERGARRLIVDARAISASGEEAALLAAVFAGRPASCHAVVVAAPDSALLDVLPASVGTTGTLTEAHRQLTSGVVRRDERGARGPGARLRVGERRALAIRQALRWADRAAREGDCERALAWLSDVEGVGAGLSADWERRRASWRAASAVQAARSSRPQPS